MFELKLYAATRSTWSWPSGWCIGLLTYRCSLKTYYMIHRMTPGKATATPKSGFCMTRLHVLTRTHVLHFSRVLVVALRLLSRKMRINISFVTPFLYPSRADHFLPKIEFRNVLNRYF